tara:strand:- start:113 stop:391 length:279 start_codon:yes stop_codon:yes gene_type:complete
MLHDNDHDTTYGAALVLIMAKQMRSVAVEAQLEDDGEVTITTELLASWADSLLRALAYSGVDAGDIIRTADTLDTHVQAQYILDTAFEEKTS